MEVARTNKGLNGMPDGQGCHADNSGRTDGRTMAAGSSVTWTHCSIHYEVT
jgi:hypothetical protein